MSETKKIPLDKIEIETESNCGDKEKENDYRKKVREMAKHPNVKNIKPAKKLVISFDPAPQVQREIIDLIERYPQNFPNRKNLIQQIERTDDIYKLRNIETQVNKQIQQVMGYTTRKAKINDDTLHLLVASTEEQKKKGLEVLSNELDEDCGMLFEFGTTKHVAFHMGEVKFPIDIVFLVQKVDGPTVVENVAENVQPEDTNVFSANAHYVLELKAGSCKKYNIQKNKTLNLRFEE